MDLVNPAWTLAKPLSWVFDATWQLDLISRYLFLPYVTLLKFDF